MVELLWRTDDCALGLSHGIFICVWLGNATVELADRIEKTIAQRRGEFPAGLGLVTVVLEKSPPPSSAARNRIAELLGRAENVKGSAVCFEGTGLRATMVRTIVTGITLLGRLAFPHKVFASIESGTAFVHACMTQGNAPVPDRRVVIDQISAWRASLMASGAPSAT